ncbi:MAG: hypothetical protein V5A72_02995 [Candidatus Nanohaloarchaea archaeon]
MAGVIQNQETVQGTVETLVFAPLRQPDLLPTVLPLIVGALVIELYFGKYTSEELGWNTSVGNAVIWATTGINLLLTTEMTQQESYVAYGLISLGGIIGYMDFFHKWPDTVAFVVSSSGIVYALAYVAAIMIKTPLSVTNVTLKGSLAFLIGINVIFKIMQSMETSRETGFNYS